MPKYYQFQIAGYYCITRLIVLLNACTFMPVTESLQKLGPPNSL